MQWRSGTWIGWMVAMTLGAGMVVADEGHPWVALVTQVQGQASVQRPGGAAESVHLLSRLAVHDVLNMSPGSQVVVAFIRGGQRFTVTHGMEIEASAVSDRTAPRQTPRDYAATLMPSGSNLDRLGGVSSQHLGGIGDKASVEPPAPRREGAPSPARASVSRAAAPSTTPPLVGGLRLPLGPALAQANTVKVQVDGHRAVGLTVEAAHVSLIPLQSQIADGSDGSSSRIVVSGGNRSEVFTIVRVTGAVEKELDAARRAAVLAYRSDPTDLSPFAFLVSKYEEHGCYEQGMDVLDGFVSVVSPGQRVYLAELKREMGDDLAQLHQRAEIVRP